MLRIAVILLLAGCGTYISLPLYDEEPVVRDHPGLRGMAVAAEHYRETGAKAPATEWDDRPDHVMRKGDAVRVRVDGEPDLDRDLLVDPEGAISYPYLDRAVVDGLRCADLRDRIRKALSSRLRDPKVSVLLQGRAEGSVDVTGMVNTRQPVRFRLRPWLSGVLTSAGGCSRVANLAQVLIVRPGEKKAIVCNLVTHARDGDARQNLRVAPGDIIVVTEIYPEEAAHAWEWGPVADFLANRASREQFLETLKDTPSPWKSKP